VVAIDGIVVSSCACMSVVENMVKFNVYFLLIIFFIFS